MLLRKILDVSIALLCSLSLSFTVWRAKKILSQDSSSETRQCVDIQLMYAYTYFRKNAKEVEKLHKETRARHPFIAYSKPINRAWVAWQLAYFEKKFMEDGERATTYANEALSLAKKHNLAQLQRALSLDFPELTTS